MQDGVLISTDLRRLYSQGDTIDTVGITSLLLLGCLVPPLTPFREIHFLLPGFRHTIDLKTQELRSDLSCTWSSQINDDVICDINTQADIVTYVLDETLENLCPTKNPIVLFSGGVDSSLLAARLSLMGWTQTSFIHHSLGEEDPDTIVARRIADELGIALDVVPWDIDHGFESITKAASLYSLPFCDHFCVQTHSLSRALISKYGGNRVVFDGAGADGCFGHFGNAYQLRILYSIPMPIRRILGAPYGLLKLWRTPSAFEYYCRLMRRSIATTDLLLSTSQNPLIGIGFYADPMDIRAIESYCHNWISSIAQSNTNSELELLTVIGLDAPTAARKNNDPLHKGSFIPKYPFLEHPIVDLAFTRARFWPDNTIPKNVLKHLLSRSISNKYVYRKKMVCAPLTEQFSHPIFLEHLEAVIENDSPLYGVVNKELVKKMLGDVTSKKVLADQTYNFLWAITFCNAWLSQLQNMTQ